MNEAAASEPTPISKRRPLTAITAVHALCNKIKMKLVRPMSQEPCLCLFGASTPVCSVTILLSSSQTLSAPPVDAPRWNEVTGGSPESAIRPVFACVFMPVVTFSPPVNHIRALANQADALKIEIGQQWKPKGPEYLRSTPASIRD